MKKLVNNPLFTQKYTKVYVTKDDKNEPFEFEVVDVNDNKLSSVKFQYGPIKENGINGIQNEDLLLMVMERLKFFQSGKFACEENENALKSLEDAVKWLRKRTTDRQNRGVEGYNKI